MDRPLLEEEQGEKQRPRFKKFDSGACWILYGAVFVWIAMQLHVWISKWRLFLSFQDNMFNIYDGFDQPFLSLVDASDPKLYGLMDGVRKSWDERWPKTLKSCYEAYYGKKHMEKILRVKHHLVNVTKRSIPVRVFVPPMISEGAPLLIHFHSGGLAYGSSAADAPYCQVLAYEVGAVVASVNYRHIPEHRFPTPFDDSIDSTEYIMRNPSSLGAPMFDPQRVVTIGASAGGYLSALVGLAAHERGLKFNGHVMVGALMTGIASVSEAHVSLMNSQMRFDYWFWSMYMQGVDPAIWDWRVHPLFANHTLLKTTSPVYVQVNRADTNRDNGIRYAKKLNSVGRLHWLDEYPCVHASPSCWAKASVDSITAILEMIGSKTKGRMWFATQPSLFNDG